MTFAKSCLNKYSKLQELIIKDFVPIYLKDAILLDESNEKIMVYYQEKEKKLSYLFLDIEPKYPDTYYNMNYQNSDYLHIKTTDYILILPNYTHFNKYKFTKSSFNKVWTLDRPEFIINL